MVQFKAVVVLGLTFCCCICASYSSLINPPSIDLCGSETNVELTAHGNTSSTIIDLSGDYENYCKLRITAPKTHAINIQFIESSIEFKKALMSNSSEEEHPPCTMSIFLPDNPKEAIWKGDLCSSNTLLELDPLTPDFRIVWTPPTNFKHARGRKLLITALGHGAVCKEPGHHICMRIGRTPLLCVSDHLLCDGNQNCPKNTIKSDEDDDLCKSTIFSQVYIQQLAVEIFKKLKMRPEIASDDNAIDKWNDDSKDSKNWQEWTHIKQVDSDSVTLATTVERHNATDTISQMLSKYGPWGYLMLGLLICGTVLMFCGLWECCFRKPKDPLDPTTIHTQPTTVLIINQSESGEAGDSGSANTTNPPNYDDLDQPPSYTALFPNLSCGKLVSSSSINIESGSSNNAGENSAICQATGGQNISQSI